jgi:large subunit ribosomal protein L19
MSKIDRIEEAYARQDLPQFGVGNTVDVHVLIREGEKERIQVFSGTVIRKRGKGLSATFTVRRIVHGEGVERIFPLHSPFVTKVEVKRLGRVRRSRLYFLRDRTGKSTRLREIIDTKRVAASKKKKKTKAAAPAPAPEVPTEPEPAEAAGEVLE